MFCNGVFWFHNIKKTSTCNCFELQQKRTFRGLLELINPCFVFCDGVLALLAVICVRTLCWVYDWFVGLPLGCTLPWKCVLSPSTPSVYSRLYEFVRVENVTTFKLSFDVLEQSARPPYRFVYSHPTMVFMLRFLFAASPYAWLASLATCLTERPT